MNDFILGLVIFALLPQVVGIALGVGWAKRANEHEAREFFRMHAQFFDEQLVSELAREVSNQVDDALCSEELPVEEIPELVKQTVLDYCTRTQKNMLREIYEDSGHKLEDFVNEQAPDPRRELESGQSDSGDDRLQLPS